MDEIFIETLTEETSEEIMIEDIPELYNKHYIAVDERNRIVDGFSDAFREPTEEHICINEQGGYQFRFSYKIGEIHGEEILFRSEENPSLFDWDGMTPLYKYEGGKVVKRSEEEIEADRAETPTPEPVPTMDERVTALEEQMVMADNTAIELFEAQLAQEEINAAQDVALIEIYEMMGGE